MNPKTRKTLAELATLLETNAAPMETFAFGKLAFAEVTSKVQCVHSTCLYVAQALRFFADEGPEVSVRGESHMLAQYAEQWLDSLEEMAAECDEDTPVAQGGLTQFERNQLDTLRRLLNRKPETTE